MLEFFFNYFFLLFSPVVIFELNLNQTITPYEIETQIKKHFKIFWSTLEHNSTISINYGRKPVDPGK